MKAAIDFVSYFHMKDLGSMAYFLGLEVHRSKQWIMLTQTKYTMELIDLARFN